MEHLHEYAAKCGITIVYEDLTPLNREGDYHAGTRTIRLTPGMSYRKERHVLAHELAHAHFGDEPTMFSCADRRQEERADEWAAHFLIDLDEYRLAEEKYGNNALWIAQDLGVLKRTVIAFERTLCRIGDTIYVHAKLGSSPKKLLA